MDIIIKNFQLRNIMIKKNDVEILSNKVKNIKIAKETVNISIQKKYISFSGRNVNISKAIDASINNTIYYPPNKTLSYNTVESIKPTIEVTNETTTNAAVRLIASGIKNIVALNFASGTNPGGGFLAGSKAQEEDLCRASTLYSCLIRKPMFYNDNNILDNNFYTDGMIYSPNVPFFRDENMCLIDNPFYLSIITSPAPNLSSSEQIDKEKLQKILTTRTIKILQVAHKNNHKNIILGAWGCGVFNNDPHMIINSFLNALQVVPYFDNVCFAVYDKRQPATVYEAFKCAVPIM